MNKKTVLTSLTAIMVAAPAIVTGVVSPAMATTWPGTDVMSENTTYDSAATLAHMGVSENGAEAQAQAYYNINSGYYLPQNSYQALQCIENKYCPGIDNITKNSSEAQGLQACPTQTFPSSDSGADAIYDCYRATCPTSNQNLASDGTMSGRVYYGERNNCTPGVNSCESGFTALNLDVAATYRNGGTPVKSYAKKDNTYVNQTGVDSTALAVPLFAGFDSTVVATYPTWAVDFGGPGYLFGGSACKGLNGVRQVAEMSGADGNNCYCWFTGYKPTSGLQTYRTIRSLAVPMQNSLNSCALNCAEACAQAVYDSSNSATEDAVALLYEHTSNDLKCVNTPYTISYKCESSDQSSVDSQVVEYLTAYTTRASSLCSKTGYSFENWGVSGETTNNTVNASTNVSTGYPYASNKTYTANWIPNIYAISLCNNSSCDSTVYEKYDTGWYSDSGATSTTSSVEGNLPSRTGFVFRGYYTEQLADVEASGNPGTQRITKEGGLPANTTFTSDASLYASWAKNCNISGKEETLTCSLTVANDGTVTYATGCEMGYGGMNRTPTTGGGTYSPTCNPNSITIVWGGIAAGRLALAGTEDVLTDYANNTAKSTVHYDDAIHTPVSPLGTEGSDNLPGQEFIGWKFLKTNPNSGS